MSVFGITNRYASALLRQAEENNQFEEVSNDIQSVHDTIAQSKDLNVVLESPVISEEKKEAILKELFSDKIGKDSMNFLRLVINKNRADILLEITGRFLELRDEKMNILPAEVTTAISLSDSEKENLKKSLEEYSGKQIRASYTVDDNIIGGFLVKLKDKMLDASVLQQLKMLKKRLEKSDKTLVN